MNASASDIKHDAFISYAGEDRDDVATPLFDRLTLAGCSIWFDKAELTLGDSLRAKIDEGLRRSRFGIVILSPAFFGKQWPQAELDGLVALEGQRGKVILPIWHNLTKETVANYSPMLSGRLAAEWRAGPGVVVRELLRVLIVPPTMEHGAHQESHDPAVAHHEASLQAEIRSQQYNAIVSLWKQMQIAVGILADAVRALQWAPDFDRSTVPNLTDAMRRSGLDEEQIAEVMELTPQARRATFNRLRDHVRYRNAERAWGEFHNALVDVKLILPGRHGQLLVRIDRQIRGALAEFMIGVETQDWDYKRKASEQLGRELTVLTEEFESGVRADFGI